MAGDLSHGAGEEGFAGFHARPRGGAGRVGERDYVKFSAVEGALKYGAYYFVHARTRDETLYGEAAYGDDESGF
jgi:hypothetical protein